MIRRGLIISFSALVLFLLLGAAVPRGMGSAADDRILTIVFTHDLHSHFDPHKTVAADGRVVSSGGYSRLSNAIQREREKNPGRVLVLDGGDFSMGTLMHTLFAEEAAELRLMGKMGYDATTIGNHELDFDSPGLASMLAAAREKGGPLPLLMASNLGFKPGQGQESGLRAAMEGFPAKDYAVVEKGGLRIGIFGLMGKDAAHDIITGKDLEIKDPVAEAGRVVKILREQEQVDLVVCLSHSGTSRVKKDSEDEILAEKVPGIDVIISGHSHTLLPQPIVKGSTIIASSGSYGSHLGVLELSCPRGELPQLRGYRLEKIAPGLPGLQPELPGMPDVTQEVEKYRGLVDRQFLAGHGFTYQQVLAESGFNLESLAAIDENPVEAGLGDLVADAFRAAVQRAEGEGGQYLHGAVQPFGEIRGTLTAGPLTVDDVFQVLSLGQGLDKTPGYPLVSFYLTGREIKNCLETQSSVAPLKSNYNLQGSGIKFLYNPHRVPFDRVYQVEISTPEGGYETLQPDKLYRICSSYMTAVMLGKMGGITHGIISVTPKDQAGNPIGDMKEALIDADPARPGVQELKEWTALAQYLQQQPDLDDDGIADLPEEYRQPGGRYSAVPSWNPVDLFKGATYITWGLLGGTLLIIGLAVLLVRWVRRFLVAKKNNRYL